MKPYRYEFKIEISDLLFLHFLFRFWVNAEAATLFCAALDLGLLKIFDALVATREEVVSHPFLQFAIVLTSFLEKIVFGKNVFIIKKN